MSDTPRTDAAIKASKGQWGHLLRDLAQEMERELAESIESHAFQVKLNREVIEREKQTHAELEQERQDRKQADLDALRALGERNDARKELEQVKTILADPLAVHLNMMRGTIKWTPANLRALLGDTEP